MKHFLIALLVVVASTSHAQDTKKDGKKDLPLKSDRTISLDLDEASWMHIDVSPDGQTLVFDVLGDLYTLSITGGEAYQLTSGLPFDSQPRFSPDGKSIVYTSDEKGGENVHILDLSDTTSSALTSGKGDLYQSPEWTPDGDYIVVAKGAGLGGVPKMHLIHKDGGKGAQLIKEPENLKTVEPAFGKDNTKIWFSHRDRNWQYNAAFPQYQIAVYDRETGKHETKTSRYGSAFRPTLSPDGKYLVYGTRFDSQTGLVKRDLATGEESWLAYPVQRDDQESIATRDVLPGMSFTPDCQFIITSYGGKIWKLPINGGEATEIPFHIEAELAVGPEVRFEYPIEDTPTFTVKQIREPVLSPDRSKLAFAALDKIYIMDYPNGTPKRVTDFSLSESNPTWSPDGTSLAFVTWDQEQGGHIYKTGFGKRNNTPIRITQSAAVYRQIAWSANNRIVAIKGAAQDFQNSYTPFGLFGSPMQLIWVSANGGSDNFITTATGLSNPHFTSESDRIFLYDNDEGLISLRYDGTDRKAYIKVTGKTPSGAKKATTATYITKAPTGDKAMVLLDNEVFVVTVPMVGGESPKVSVLDPDKAEFPAERLTVLGGEFPEWSNGSENITWSIGNAFFDYNIPEAKAFRDSVEAVTKEAKGKEKADEEDETDTEEKEEEETAEYAPNEIRVKVEADRDIPRGVVMLTNARVITMEGDEVIEEGSILIKDNRIVAVGDAESFDLPEKLDIIDVNGKTIVPGFVDTHAHIRPAWEIHKDESWAFLANLAYGVTTIRDPQTGTTDVLSYEDQVKAGNMMGPRIYSTGPGVGFWNTKVRDLDHAKEVMRRYSEYYDTKTIKMYITGNRQERQWIIEAAREYKLMPTTEGALDLKLDLTQVIDGYPGHEHNFPIYPLYNDMVTLLTQMKTAYTPTLLVTYGGPWGENYYYATENVHGDEKLSHFTPHEELDGKSRRRGRGGAGWFMDEEHAFDKHAAFVKDLYDAGGIAGIGSHGQLQGLGYHWELWSVQSGGLTPHEALRVATIIGADAIGLKQDVGSIKAGKLADLVILNENPLDDIRNTNTVEFVMKNGRLYTGDKLDEYYPAKIERGDFWWNDYKPEGLPGIKK